MYMWMPMSPKARNIGFPGIGVRGCREPPDMGAGNLTQALCKSSMCSPLLSHLSSPTTSFIIRKFKHTKVQRKGSPRRGLQPSIHQGKRAEESSPAHTVVSSIIGKWNSVFNASPNLWHSALTALANKYSSESHESLLYSSESRVQWQSWAAAQLAHAVFGMTMTSVQIKSCSQCTRQEQKRMH